MGKDEAIEKFIDTRETYMRYIPKLRQLVFEMGFGESEVPNADGETYKELLHREESHFTEMYNEDHYESLNSHPMSEEEYSNATFSFFTDLEDIMALEYHVDHLLSGLE